MLHTKQRDKDVQQIIIDLFDMLSKILATEIVHLSIWRFIRSYFYLTVKFCQYLSKEILLCKMPFTLLLGLKSSHCVLQAILNVPVLLDWVSGGSNRQNFQKVLDLKQILVGTVTFSILSVSGSKAVPNENIRRVSSSNY